MNVVGVGRMRCEIATNVTGVTNSIKRLVQKLVKALLIDADTIFKSKDWPYLWSK